MRAIEDAFKDFTSRDDIAVVLINQYVRTSQALGGAEAQRPQIADMVRHLVDAYTKVLSFSFFTWGSHTGAAGARSP